jgi:hypothetical protein
MLVMPILFTISDDLAYTKLGNWELAEVQRAAMDVTQSVCQLPHFPLPGSPFSAAEGVRAAVWCSHTPNAIRGVLIL